MSNDKEREKRIYRVTLTGSVVNLLLLLFKFAAGILGHSAAMVADAVHSLSDFATDLIVIAFVRISSKPEDAHHAYGHGKYETLATAIIGTVLFGVAVGICWNGVTAIYDVICGEQLTQPSMLALGAALLSVALKEWAYRFTVAAGQRLGSQAVVANAWHHRSDALSSIGTAIGIGGALALGDNWTVLDPIAAIIVSVFIIRTAWQLLRSALGELLEESLPEQTESEIEAIATAEPDVSEVHHLRTRRIGSHIAIEMHVRMPGNTSLYDAHLHATNVEQALRRHFGPSTYINLHVEPLKVNGVYVKPSDTSL